MRPNIVKDKSFDFSLRIIRTYRYLAEEKREFVLSKQLLRSGTAIGARIRESERAESKADFIHKLSISLKEANETAYWIDLLHQSAYIEEPFFLELHPKIDELNRLLTAILKSSKSNR